MRAVRSTPQGVTVVDVDVPDRGRRTGKDRLGQHLRWVEPEEAVP